VIRGASRPGAPEDDPEPGTLPGRGTLRILLAEDNRINQVVAARMLERCGCEVTVVANGQQAVEAAARESFDAILMDVQMPGMDGFEATRLIRERESEQRRHTPVIAMTAHAMAGYRERCLAAGMDDYLAKPVRPRELWQTVTRNLPQALSNPKP
jgi:CheY-like chemotaxis protein